MKALLMTAILLSTSLSYAWTSHDPSSKQYTFKYQLSGESLEIKRSAGSYEEAYEIAAQQCFNHFKGHGRVSEDRGLDIIDVCANPRS